MDEYAMGSLKKSLEEDNVFFKQMIDLIPVKAYFNSETKSQIIDDELQQMKQHVQDGPDTVVKNKKRNNAELSDKAKLKRARFDPARLQTVSQVQEHLIKDTSADAENKHSNKVKKKDKIKEAEEDLMMASPAANLEELHNKVQQKIELLRAKRKALNTQDYVNKMKLKRKMSKMKQKMKKRTEKHMKGGVNGAVNGPSDAPAPAAPSSKPIYNKEGKMVFSKFDFTASGSSNKPSGGPKGKDYKKLLQKIEKDKDKIEKLKERDEEAAKTAVEKAQWKKVLQKAEGVKLKDNPDLLKKSMKRKEKRSKKSKKEWVERQSKVDEKMKAKQDKRKANIDKKKKGRIDKKIKKAKKKGRIVPGF